MEQLLRLSVLRCPIIQLSFWIASSPTTSAIHEICFVFLSSFSPLLNHSFLIFCNLLSLLHNAGCNRSLSFQRRPFNLFSLDLQQVSIPPTSQMHVCISAASSHPARCWVLVTTCFWRPRFESRSADSQLPDISSVLATGAPYLSNPRRACVESTLRERWVPGT